MSRENINCINDTYNTTRRGGLGKNFIHYPMGHFLLQEAIFRAHQCGSTYNRAMTTIFHDMMYKEFEVSVDDIIVKLKEKKDHVISLRKLFDRLKKFNLKLNPKKCVFRVTSSKLLVSWSAIEELRWTLPKSKLPPNATTKD